MRPLDTKIRKEGSLEASHNNQEDSLSMQTIAQMPADLQSLFTTTANELAKEQASFNASGNSREQNLPKRRCSSSSRCFIIASGCIQRWAIADRQRLRLLTHRKSVSLFLSTKTGQIHLQILLHPTIQAHPDGCAPIAACQLVSDHQFTMIVIWNACCEPSWRMTWRV